MLIEANHLRKVYRINKKEPGLAGTVKSLFHREWTEKIALDDISFSMREGQTMACIGENGAGKSTLIKMLIGVLTPTEGEIRVYGKGVRENRQEYLRKIGVIFGQKTNLWVDIPVIESYNAIQVLYKVERQEFKRNLDQVTELLELGPILNIPARKLSLGQRMKADIGMVFLHSPKLLFLDEPTIGLDVNVKHTIRSFLREMNREKGTSILLTSHDLDDIETICDDAVVLSKGKIFYDGPLEQLKKDYVKTRTIDLSGRTKRDIREILPDVQVTAKGHKVRIVYETGQYETEEVLSALSGAFDITDITISEPDIEDVVSRIFLDEKGN